jgi:hypothetical protein
MRIVKKAANVALAGLMMGASASVWAQVPAGNTTGAGRAGAALVASGPLSAAEIVMQPSEQVQAARRVINNCKASHLYTADDIVGDKSTCIMGTYNLPGGMLGTATSVAR